MRQGSMPSVSLRLTFASAVACTIALFLSSTPINAFAIRNHSHSHSNSHSSRTNATKLQAKETNNNNSEKKGTINPLRLAVLKLGLTELKWTSPLNYEKRVGTYDCASCGTVLFDSSGKYDSGSGWPSFWKTKDVDRVAYKREWDGRVECSCGSCGGHLGHAFPDGPQRKDIPDELLETIPDDDLKTSDPKNVYTRLPRYCMNGASMKFTERQ